MSAVSLAPSHGLMIAILPESHLHYPDHKGFYDNVKEDVAGRKDGRMSVSGFQHSGISDK